ncbi:MAG: MMPL family transporter [Myxococcales bacterium]|nr:MMPL family transporter [Myxococcales bacterium]
MTKQRRWIEAWVDFIEPRPWSILAVTLVITVVAGYLATGLRVRTDFAAFLPDHFESVRGFDEITKRVGGLGFLILAVEGKDKKQVSQMVKRLAQEVEKEKKVVRSVRMYKVDPFVQKRALYLMQKGDLVTLRKRVEKLRDEVRREVRRQNPMLVDISDDAAKKKFPKLEVDDLLARYGLSRELLESDGLISNKAGTLAVLLIQPSGLENDMPFITRLVERMRVAEQRTRKALPFSAALKVHYSGRYMVLLDENNALNQQIGMASGLSLSGILLLLLLYTRKKRSILLIGTPLLLGVVWTAGLAYLLTGGEINSITAFIVAILFGLGIDMGIHFFMHFLQIRQSGLALTDALKGTLLSTGKAGSIAVFTSSGAFLVIMLTDFKGLNQFGMVAGLGLMLNLIAFLVVFPSLAIIMARRSPIVKQEARAREHKEVLPVRTRFWAFGMVLCIGLSSWGLFVLFSGRIQFDDDVWNLVTRGEAVRVYDRLKKDVFFGEAEPAVMLFSSWESLHKAQRRLDKELREKRWPSIRSVLSQLSVVPDHAEEKKPILAQIDTLLNDKAFRSLDQEDHAKEIALLKRFRTLTHAKPYTLKELPKSVRDSLGGDKPLMFIIPALNPTQVNNAIRLSQDMLKIKQSFEDKKVILGDSNMVLADMFVLLGRDGPRAVGLACLVILIVLLFGFRRQMIAVPLVLVPLSAGLFMLLGLMWAFGLRLNAYNVMALPVTLGLGIDHSVYIFHRWDEDGRGSVIDSLRSVMAAISLAALTSIIGFGALIPLMHPGLRQLGILTILGIFSGVVTALLITPSLIGVVMALYSRASARKYQHAHVPQESNNASSSTDVDSEPPGAKTADSLNG